jgi:hypothetical protein
MERSREQVQAGCHAAAAASGERKEAGAPSNTAWKMAANGRATVERKATPRPAQEGLQAGMPSPKIELIGKLDAIRLERHS